jgi:regulator of sirC expression with transglutaminase-like and TPR domain
MTASPQSASPHIEALFALLDDPDPIVKQSVHARLLDIGPDIAPMLRRVAEHQPNELVGENASEVLRRMGLRQFRRQIANVLNVSSNEDIDLEQGVFAVALLRYPEIKIAEYSERLDVMALQLEQRLRAANDDIRVIYEMNEYLSEDLGYRGCNQDRFYDPDHSCMNRVMDSRVGIPVTLSVMYLLLAERLSLPIHGTNVPARFLMKYRAPGGDFYIDAFSGGSILDHGDCRRYLRDLGLHYHPSYLAAATNRQIVARMMRNLAEIYRATDRNLATELDAAIAMLTGGEG